MTHPAWIEIDLAQFRKNIATIRRHTGSCLLCLPIKANAYGHGLCPIGKAAQEAGVDYLAVAHLQEGIELRHFGIQIPILVLGAIHEDQVADLLAFNLEISISSKLKADFVAATCAKLGKTCRIHLEIDTGMQRTGVRPATAKTLLPYLQSLSSLHIAGIYSHLATADRPHDPFAHHQIDTFTTLLQDPLFQHLSVIRHLASSGGVIHYPDSHLDMVRPSLAVFGYLPPHTPEPYSTLAPCLSLKARVSYFKVVNAGEGISYNHSYITPHQTRIATIPVGYGDGYRRALSNRGSVLIRGKQFPIRGTICMDQFMVDIGDQEAYVGDEVVLIGKQGSEEITLQEIASLCDTIPYEILCQFNDRIPRVYLNA